MGPDVRVQPAQLEEFRAYLRLVARLDFDPSLQGKVDLSGVIQQTLLEATEDLSKFRGAGRNDLLTWLHQILARNMLDEISRLKHTQQDVTLDCSLDELSVRVRARLAMDESSPRTVACRQEELLRMSVALERLPADQQTAVLLHHLQGMRLAQVASHMNRSKPAIAGLLHRGMTRLRDLLLNERDQSTVAIDSDPSDDTSRDEVSS